MDELAPISRQAESSREVQPSYQVNWDPFLQIQKWKELCDDPDFGVTLGVFIRLEEGAIQAGVSHPTAKGRRFSSDDMYLQAFFLSYRGLISSKVGEHRVRQSIDSLRGTIDASEIINFADLLGSRGSDDERYFHTLVDVLYWFGQLIAMDERRGFYPRDKFAEFNRGMSTRHDILRKIGGEMQRHGEFNIQFYQSGGYGTMDFFFDVDTRETRVFMKDFVMDSTYGFRWFSDFLDTENPFGGEKSRNFLYPMGYGGYTFPLMNVVEIKLQMQDGSERVYRNGVQQVRGVLSQTQSRVAEGHDNPAPSLG